MFLPDPTSIRAAGPEIDRPAIRRIEKLVWPWVRRTPVAEVRGSDFGLASSVRVFLKLESLQYAGSFKTRGAFANLLARDVPRAGVVAASGGNHGASVAFAARALGVPAAIFVPGNSPPAKRERIREYGAQLFVTGDCYDDALEAAEDWASRKSAMSIHAFNQPETLLGQGSLALEFERQCPRLDTVLTAVGGGGLIGGVAAWYRGRTDVIGVEPEQAPTLTTALRAGHPVETPCGGVAADSLAVKRAGDLMFPIAQRFVRNVVLVSDEDILQAQRSLWDMLRVVAEPGGAAALAALLSRRYVPASRERVGVIVCGGNAGGVCFDREAPSPGGPPCGC
jgi:threonine dehydratase